MKPVDPTFGSGPALPLGARGGTAEEELIVAEPADGADEVGLSLYLDPALLSRLTREDPLVRLHGGNVADWCTALEGVSHFLEKRAANFPDLDPSRG